MNKVIPPINLPIVRMEHLRPPMRGLNYLRDFTRAIKDHIDKLTTAANTATQGVGPAIASATTISVSNAMHHITGTNTINTITPSPGFSGGIDLIADGAFSLGTAGNIAIAKGPFGVGESVRLVWDDIQQMWYPRS